MLDFARSPSLWERVRTSPDFKKHRDEISALYNKAFVKSPSAHTAKEIITGNDGGKWRDNFDFLQSAALMSLIYPDNEEYFNNLLEILWVYCDEYTWAPTGHYNHYYNRTPADYDIGLIDIFAASVAFSLAEIKNLFGDRLPELIRDRISAEIRRRTIEPFLTRDYFWEKHPNNWAAVCAGGVGCAIMYEDPELFLSVRERLDSAMQVYLDSYKDDGVCVEGVGYWGFGFGFFVSYAMLEKELTCGEVDWFKLPKVKSIATFLQKMFLDKDVFVTYSDCSSKSKYILGLSHILKDIYGDEIEKLPLDAGFIAEDNTHFNFSLRSVIYFNPEYCSDVINQNVSYNMDSSHCFVKRTPYYSFATKGGNNGESHNHNDVGSFIVSRHNRQLLCDLGAGPYEDGYHFEKRYTFFNPSSFSHNLPFFDGEGQDGVRRENVTLNVSCDMREVEMDFTNGYGIDYLKRAVRHFTLDENKITLKDTFILTKESVITERFVSRTEPVITDEGILLDDALLKCSLKPELSVKVLSEHLSSEPKYNCYIIDYILPKGESEFCLTISLPDEK